MSNKKTSIIIVIVLVLAIVSLGVAFAAFSTTLNITGHATVESTSWNIVFEGITNENTLDAPTLTGRASVTTVPTIKNNATEISSYAVTLQAPGDSVTYNFKVHNKGSFAASVTSIVINSGVNLTTNTSKRTSEANTLNAMDYKLYYTDNNELVGQSAKDCLEPGESENLSLRIVFSSTSATNTNVLPSEDLLLDNLGIVVNYIQAGNGSCLIEAAGETVADKPFQNIDGAYYTYEGKSFIGTGVNNVIITENIVSKAAYSTEEGIDNGDGTYSYPNRPAANAAAAYCTGCRLMTVSEVCSWVGESGSSCVKKKYPKIIANYNGTASPWWLDDSFEYDAGYIVTYVGVPAVGYGWMGCICKYSDNNGVRPAVSIPNGATITGSGTQGSPYVITINN